MKTSKYNIQNKMFLVRFPRLPPVQNVLARQRERSVHKLFEGVEFYDQGLTLIENVSLKIMSRRMHSSEISIER